MVEKRKWHCCTTTEGFTLIEVLVAITIFTVGILAANVMQGTSIRSNHQASNIFEAVAWGTDRLEQLMTGDYNDPLLDDQPVAGDPNGNGTGEDVLPIATGPDGIDDNGGNFGLDDFPGDGGFVSPDGRFNIAWNVAVDYPLEGLKTIRLIINRTDWGQAKAVSITYVKCDNI